MIDRNKVLKLREEKGLTQYELAKLAGISVATLNKIETSDFAKPFPSTLKKIAVALDVEPNELHDEENYLDMDVSQTINLAMKDRRRVINNLMEIDSFMFSYIMKQLNIFSRDLGEVFGISDHMLLEAALFSGLSWSRPGNTTHESNYSKVLGDLLALQNIQIEIKMENISVRTPEQIEEHSKKRGIYGICDNKGALIRIGETTNLTERFNYHIGALRKEEYPAMREYISGTAEFGRDYYFLILAFEPNIGRKLTALQSDTWRYYAETMLIIKNNTYLKGNRYKENGIFTGDIYIPIKVQKEMIRYYHKIDF